MRRADSNLSQTTRHQGQAALAVDLLEDTQGVIVEQNSHLITLRTKQLPAAVPKNGYYGLVLASRTDSKTD